MHPASVLTTSAQTPVKYPGPSSAWANSISTTRKRSHEYAPDQQSTVIQYLDAIRTRSGIPGVLGLLGPGRQKQFYAG
ncbi:hypothetical protein ACQ86N_24875 [Puia sp. P3]|uniref:hypothetical protein n=1 Tax=Puia sp. P3 TaxID=3423952 RepID=UPI003D671243